MTIRMGVVMDPVATIKIKKDTTFAMLIAAQTCGRKLHYFEQTLDGMGGTGVFRLRQNDHNVNVILEMLTANANHTVMAQRFTCKITAGDKRTLLIDGEPVPFALARILAKGETRANLAAGGCGIGVELKERDRWICSVVALTLREMGLVFVGLDVIGDYLTEIDVTNPTCVRELDAQFGLDIGTDLMNAIEMRLR